MLAWFTPVKVQRWRKRGLTPSGKPRYGSKTEYDAKGMFELLLRLKNNELLGHKLVVAIENQQGYSNDSKSNVLMVGMGFGRWLHTLELLGLDYTRVPPSQWKPRCLPIIEGTDTVRKAAALNLARKVFPRAPLTLAKHEAQAEALLLADFLRRKTENIAFLRTPPKRKKKTKEEIKLKLLPKKRRTSTALQPRVSHLDIKLKRKTA